MLDIPLILRRELNFIIQDILEEDHILIKASDWELFLLIPCETIEQAVFIESRIKRMKSRKYIENLKKYPEMVEKILKEFHK